MQPLLPPRWFWSGLMSCTFSPIKVIFHTISILSFLHWSYIYARLFLAYLLWCVWHHEAGVCTPSAYLTGATKYCSPSSMSSGMCRKNSRFICVTSSVAWLPVVFHSAHMCHITSQCQSPTRHWTGASGGWRQGVHWSCNRFLALFSHANHKGNPMVENQGSWWICYITNQFHWIVNKTAHGDLLKTRVLNIYKYYLIVF